MDNSIKGAAWYDRPKFVAFPGAGSFVVKKGNFSNFIPDQGSYVPVYNTNQTLAEQELGQNLPKEINVNEYGGVGQVISPATYSANPTGTVASGISNSTVAVSSLDVLPDFAKLSCKQIEQYINDLKNSMMTAKNEALSAKYAAAISAAQTAYQTKGCKISMTTDDIKVQPTGDQTVPKPATSNALSGVKIPTWAWIAGGALLLVAALK